MGYSTRDNDFYRAWDDDLEGPRHASPSGSTSTSSAPPTTPEYCRPSGRSCRASMSRRLSWRTARRRSITSMPTTSCRRRAASQLAAPASRSASSASGCRRRPPTWPGALHAPALVLVYESAASARSRTRLPLSIGDGELAETADAVGRVPEIFAYWLQAGRIDVGFLGAAQLDRFGNINSTVIGDYDASADAAAGRRRRARDRRVGRRGHRHHAPSRRARSSSAATSARRSGFGDGPGDRERLGLRGGGPQMVITDLGILRARPRDVRAGADRAASRRHAPSRRSPRPVGRCGSPTTLGHDRAARPSSSWRRCAALRPRDRDAVHVRAAARAGRVRRRARWRRSAPRSRGSARARVFLIADGQAQGDRRRRSPTQLGRSCVAARWDEVVQHVPVELAERARAAATERRRRRRRVPWAAARRPGWPRRSR